jgi:hypothetical protein
MSPMQASPTKTPRGLGAQGLGSPIVRTDSVPTKLVVVEVVSPLAKTALVPDDVQDLLDMDDFYSELSAGRETSRKDTMLLTPRVHQNTAPRRSVTPVDPQPSIGEDDTSAQVEIDNLMYKLG